MVNATRPLSILLLLMLSMTDARAREPAPICAIDMGSNNFRRIVGSFDNGRYEQRPVEKRTLGVGDDVAKNGRISDAKLAEIAETLAAFKASCDKDGATPVVAIGTAAFRDAPNGARGGRDRGDARDRDGDRDREA